ncbi:MAG: bifunctional pyr operon transcriptional regulator/uracil phosphoribosyltransferase PyrR [Brachymonas sp.]|nr:bifunctional pyr operon transcriptional regulator/uracil phosphoribosyltransferase PyrR [Brachymonas sp.]
MSETRPPDSQPHLAVDALPEAEALYQRLCQLLQPLRQPHWQVVGITSGGAWMAERLQQDWNLAAIGVISTAMHRDDFARRGLSRTVETRLPFAVDGAHILLLDDVLHTGRTIRAALNEIYDFGRPASVQLAVLVERTGRELPICATVAAAHMDLPQQQNLHMVRNEAGRFDFHLRDMGQSARL